MNYTEDQILEKAKLVLGEVNGAYFNEKNIRKIVFDEDEVIIRGVDIGKAHPTWTIVIDEPVTDSTDFLSISDETGEPLYIQGKHSVAVFKKNSDGKYFCEY